MSACRWVVYIELDVARDYTSRKIVERTKWKWHANVLLTITQNARELNRKHIGEIPRSVTINNYPNTSIFTKYTRNLVFKFVSTREKEIIFNSYR